MIVRVLGRMGQCWRDSIVAVWEEKAECAAFVKLKFRVVILFGCIGSVRCKRFLLR